MALSENFILWLIGPTSGGKTTIASHFASKLKEKNIPVIHYDGDEVRDLFGADLGFSEANRMLVVKTLVYVANKACDAGFNVVISALTANQQARTYVEKSVNNLVTGYVRCSLEECIRRDPKGLYKKAISGEIKTVIGYNSPYIPPDNPDIILDTESNSVDEIIKQLEGYFQDSDS